MKNRIQRLPVHMGSDYMCNLLANPLETLIAIETTHFRSRVPPLRRRARVQSQRRDSDHGRATEERLPSRGLHQRFSLSHLPSYLQFPAGSVQETPLTQFLMKQAAEKFKKSEEKRRVFEEKRRERKKAEVAAKKERERPERPAKKERDGISFTNSSYGGRGGRDSPVGMFPFHFSP